MKTFIKISLLWLILIAGVEGQTDTDSDGIPDSEDNCPEVFNEIQLDFNENNIGDVCELLSCEDLEEYQNYIELNEYNYCEVNSDCGLVNPVYEPCCTVVAVNNAVVNEFNNIQADFFECEQEWDCSVVDCFDFYSVCINNVCTAIENEYDCMGVYGGTAFIDDCGNCVGGNTGLEENYAMDCAGVCDGEAYENECGCISEANEWDPEFCYGCMDPEASNFDPEAIYDDGTCNIAIRGTLVLGDGWSMLMIIDLGPNLSECDMFKFISDPGYEEYNNINVLTSEDPLFNMLGLIPYLYQHIEINGHLSQCDETEVFLSNGVTLLNTDCYYNDDCDEGFVCVPPFGDCNFETGPGECVDASLYNDCDMGDINYVCACNGETYTNECVAIERFGIGVAHEGACETDGYGCTDPNAYNYNPNAVYNDGSCVFVNLYCCSDPGACNYSPDSACDVYDCYYDFCYGCPDESAFNFDPNALYDDGSCFYCIPGDVTGDDIIDVLDAVVVVGCILEMSDDCPCGDMTGDGVVDVLDVVQIVEIILQE